MRDSIGQSIQALLYFSSRSTAGRIDLGLPEQLSLAAAAGPGDIWRYIGRLPDGTDCQLEGARAHDTHLFRFTVQKPGEQPPSSLPELKQSVGEPLVQAWQTPAAPRPWAASFLYSAQVSGPVSASELAAWAGAFGDATARLPAAFETTPFGWLLLVNEGRMRIDSDHEIALRELLLVTPVERAEQVQRYFTGPLGQGLARIELYLHKARHHAAQQVLVREDLLLARAQLQESMALALQTADFSQLHREQLELEDISRRLMRFLTQKAYAEVLLNSLRANLAALDDHLERVKLAAGIYSREQQSLSRQIEQLESDLHNAQVVSESTYAFQDVQRGVEANRLERASYLMSGTAGLLAGIAIFNSFLDIWSLAVLDSKLILPPTWLRILLGLLAGLSLPVGAFRIVERRKQQAVVWIGIALSTLAAAVLSTLWVN